MGFSDYNANPDLNVSISGVNIGEGCPPSGINNAIRQIMADAKTEDGAVVHVAGNETVSGTKTFSGNVVFSGGLVASGTTPVIRDGVTSLIYSNTSLTRAQSVSSNVYAYPVRYADSNGDFLSYVEYYAGSDGGRRARLAVYKQDGAATSLQCGFTGAGVAYANAPTPANYSENGTSIATTAWVTSATAVVHTSGNESIGGVKTFSGGIVVRNSSPTLALRDPDWKKGGSTGSGQWQGLYFQDQDNVTGGAVAYRYGSDKDSYVSIVANNMVSSGASGAAEVRLSYNPQGVQAFYPGDTGVMQLGSPGHRWGQLYVSAAAISTSDERAKMNIARIPDNVLDAWGGVQWQQYQFNDAVAQKGVDDARLHNGLIAQRIDSAFHERGLDASRYGLFCYDAWEGEPEERDDKGNVVTPARVAGEAYSVRYEEALAMEAAYQRRRADRAEARITALEQRLDELEAAIATLGA